MSREPVGPLVLTGPWTTGDGMAYIDSRNMEPGKILGSTPTAPLGAPTGDRAALATQNLSVTSELLVIARALDAAGVDFIVLKGVPLAYRVFGRLHARRIRDNDILVHPRDVAAALGATGSRLTYVDCNAIAPRTAREVAAVIAPTGSPFVDAGIVGGPPRDAPSPRFYASGPGRAHFGALADAGLDVRLLGDEVGEASAVKMCYAALTKGTTAIATELLVAARKLGVYDTLIAELRDSQGAQAKRMADAVPAMPGKAHRWVAEMEEIARTF